MEKLIRGSNGSRARRSYVMRNNYKNQNKFGDNYPPTLDLWYESLYYGREDYEGQIVVLSERFLAQIKDTGDDTILVLDFVADAFHGLKGEYNNLRREGAIAQGGPLSTITAVAGFPAGGSSSMYDLYMKMLYRVFAGSFLSKGPRLAKIITYDDYMKVFIEFVDKMATSYPLTKTGFLRSKYSTPMIGGLMIDIAKGDHANDIMKEQAFLNDPNFDIFRKVAESHGFFIDKNAPWRLAADITSPRMKKYIVSQGKQSEQLFQQCYYQVRQGGFSNTGSDLELLQTYIQAFYKTLVTESPFATGTRTSKNSCRNYKIPREQLDLEAAQIKYGEMYWLKILFYVKMKESAMELTMKEVAHKMSTMLKKYKFLDKQAAIRYIYTTANQ